jgi:7-keto-8-aminopelargonate synthetase-like enzyme
MKQNRLMAQIRMTRRLLSEYHLPVMVPADSPIWFVRVGTPTDTIEMARRLQDEGFYVNPSGYPAVPMGYAGLRLANSLYLDDGAYEAVVEAIARHLPQVIGETEIVIDLTEERSPRS